MQPRIFSIHFRPPASERLSLSLPRPRLAYRQPQARRTESRPGLHSHGDRSECGQPRPTASRRLRARAPRTRREELGQEQTTFKQRYVKNQATNAPLSQQQQKPTSRARQRERGRERKLKRHHVMRGKAAFLLLWEETQDLWWSMAAHMRTRSV